MDLTAQLAALNLPPVVGEQVRELLAAAQADGLRKDAQLRAADLKIAALTQEVAYLRRMRYGVKSEALDTQTRELFEDTLASDLAAAEARLEQQQAELDAIAGTQAKLPRPPRERAGRQPLPAHLPRIDHRHEAESCTCGQCGQGLVLIGEDVSEQLGVEPSKFYVDRHIRPQYACRSCETVTAAPIPPAVIDGGLASTSVLAWVTVGKYLDHLPLYRLEQIAARDGVTLARSTLAEWIGRIGVALQPLADRLGELLRHRAILHADETPVQQLDPGSGKTHRAYLWAYCSTPLDTGPPLVVFDYQTSRSGRHARAFLGAWQGELMVDDYGGYKQLFGQGVTELGCVAHARRKFFDLNQAQVNPIAQEALARFAQWYAIEASACELTCEQRAELRKVQTRPLVDDMQRWLLATRMNVANGSSTAKAIDYSLKRWSALTCFADNGDRPIDNNVIENAIRPICIGKKNWLFMGSERAGQRAAAIQSLFATAKLNGLDPAAWLRDTLDRLPTCLNSQIDSLLPLRA
jgi:transposase